MMKKSKNIDKVIGKFKKIWKKKEKIGKFTDKTITAMKKRKKRKEKKRRKERKSGKKN